MKKIIVLLFGILISPIVFAQENKVQALMVQLKDGSTNFFVLPEKPIVTLPGDSIVISTNDISTTYLRANVETIYFDKVDWNAVESIGVKNLIFYIDEEDISISGLKDNTIVSVVGVDGKVLSVHNSNKSGTVKISMAAMSSGVYIISFGDRKIKITK